LYLVNLSLPERRQAVQGLPQVYPSEKNEQRETGAALAYASYRLHQMITTASQTARTRICQQQRERLENSPIQLQPGRFGLTGAIYTTSIIADPNSGDSRAARVLDGCPHQRGRLCGSPQPPVHTVFQQGGLQYILPPHHPSPRRMGSHYALPGVAASPTTATGPTTNGEQTCGTDISRISQLV
ncbi:MAG: hypothetical protein GY696_06410, partial [Gammaproteobacteria bacterium]|nr:hypothetical protein [Gammaproteobacteria bacterium]